MQKQKKLVYFNNIYLSIGFEHNVNEKLNSTYMSNTVFLRIDGWAVSRWIMMIKG